MEAHLLNGAALAYMGDAVYESYVRQHVLASGITQANKLHRAAIKYVEASGQAYVMQHWIASDTFLTEAEIDMYRRGRNYKANTKAKNASIQDYRQASGFESLLGWLFLDQQIDRLETLIKQAIQLIESRESNDQQGK